jgi:hypothetical protein
VSARVLGPGVDARVGPGERAWTAFFRWDSGEAEEADVLGTCEADALRELEAWGREWLQPGWHRIDLGPFAGCFLL